MSHVWVTLKHLGAGDWNPYIPVGIDEHRKQYCVEELMTQLQDHPQTLVDSSSSSLMLIIENISVWWLTLDMDFYFCFFPIATISGLTAQGHLLQETLLICFKIFHTSKVWEKHQERSHFLYVSGMPLGSSFFHVKIETAVGQLGSNCLMGTVPLGKQVRDSGRGCSQHSRVVRGFVLHSGLWP